MTEIYQETDVIIVGAGPVGIELSAALKLAGVDHLLIEAEQIGSTIQHWPRNTHFFSSSENISIAGVPIQTTDQGRVTAEEYLAYLRSVMMQFGLRVNAYEPVQRIRRAADCFHVHTQHRTGERIYAARLVALATGGLSRPRLLGIPGEELPHVSHFFRDPHDYFQQRLLIVGGRNSALEAALRCWRAGAQVTVCYRRQELGPDNARGFILEDFETRLRHGQIAFLPGQTPVEITPEAVTLAPCGADGCVVEGQRSLLPVDFMLLQTGYVADMRLFEGLGIELLGERRVPHYNPQTMETNVPGAFVVGTAAGGTQQDFKLFIETSHDEIPRIVDAMREKLRK
jgi:thioredoxin reductase (NADPH)